MASALLAIAMFRGELTFVGLQALLFQSFLLFDLEVVDCLLCTLDFSRPHLPLLITLGLTHHALVLGVVHVLILFEPLLLLLLCLFDLEVVKGLLLFLDLPRSHLPLLVSLGLTLDTLELTVIDV
jgi:hypothetical protein